MNFFKPEDFDDIPINETWDTSIVANRANAKLEREGTIVYGILSHTIDASNTKWDTNKIEVDTHKALLLNVEPIEKCKHDKNKLAFGGVHNAEFTFRCDCGAKVKPTAFEEVKN